MSNTTNEYAYADIDEVKFDLDKLQFSHLDSKYYIISQFSARLYEKPEDMNAHKTISFTDSKYIKSYKDFSGQEQRDYYYPKTSCVVIKSPIFSYKDNSTNNYTKKIINKSYTYIILKAGNEINATNREYKYFHIYGFLRSENKDVYTDKDSSSYGTVYGSGLVEEVGPSDNMFVGFDNVAVVNYDANGNPVYSTISLEDTSDNEESVNSYQNTLNTYFPTYKSKRNRVATFDFTKPWETYPEYYTMDYLLANKKNGLYEDKNIFELRPSYKSGAVSLNLYAYGYNHMSTCRKQAYVGWSDDNNRFYLGLDGNIGLGFSVGDNYYIEAIEFEGKDSNIFHSWLRYADKDRDWIYSAGSNLWVKTKLSNTADIATDPFTTVEQIATIKVYYTSYDDWEGFDNDKTSLDKLDNSGNIVGTFNFSRPWTLNSKYTENYFSSKDIEALTNVVFIDNKWGGTGTTFKKGHVSLTITPLSTGEVSNGAYLTYLRDEAKNGNKCPFYVSFRQGTAIQLTVDEGYTLCELQFDKSRSTDVRLFTPYNNGSILSSNNNDTSLPMYSDDTWSKHWTTGGKNVKSLTLYRVSSSTNPKVFALSVSYKKSDGSYYNPKSAITYVDYSKKDNTITFNFRNAIKGAYKELIKLHRSDTNSYVADKDAAVSLDTDNNTVSITYDSWNNVDYVEFTKGALYSNNSDIKDNEYTKITFSNGSPAEPLIPTDNPNKTNNSSESTIGPITFTDTGDKGYSVDPNEILFAGGQEVIPQTFAQKDNTLFMGNYKEENALLKNEELINNIKGSVRVSYFHGKYISKGQLGSLYMYNNQLKYNSYRITTFKGGEWYRFGLIFQDERGQWSGVIPIGDYKNSLYPQDTSDMVVLTKAAANIPSNIVKELYNLGYRRVQGVVVYPSKANRRVVCQGVLCPTVYNINDRINNAPYAVSSWFFREMRATDSNGKPYLEGTQNLHNCNIYNDIYDAVDSKYKVSSKLVTDSTSSYLQVNGSISAGTFGGGHTDATTGGGYFGNGNTSSSGSTSEGSSSSSSGDTSFESIPANKSFKAEISSASVYHKYAYETNNNIDYFVDWNTLTMNTPEVNFSTTNTSHDIQTENLKLRIIGIIPLTSSSNDIYVNTNSEYIKQDVAVGLKKINTTYNNNSYQGGNLRETTFEWNDFDYHLGDDKHINLDSTDKQSIMTSFSLNNFDKEILKKLGVTEIPFGGIKGYPIYPWQGAKSLLGQPKEVIDGDYKGKVFDGLNKKVIANIRTASMTYYFPNKALSYDIGNAGIYDEDIPLVKLDNDINDTDYSSSFNYYGELDTIINPSSYYYTYYGSIYYYSLANLQKYNWGHREGQSPLSIGTYTGLHNIVQNSVSKDLVRIRYKSSPHVAFHLKYSSYGAQTILPSFSYDGYTFGKFNDLDKYDSTNPMYIVPGWSDKIRNKTITKNISGAYYSLSYLVSQQNIDLAPQDLGRHSMLVGHNDNTVQYYGYLYIGELYQDDPEKPSDIFGGDSPFSYEQNQWHKAGPVVELNKGNDVSVDFLQGDTYYQRYDCLKTYPYSSEDPNQIVEILSFMCETRMNIDGRYDINRGNSSNINATPQNFNLFNPVYTQEDNFINHYYLVPEKNKDDNFSNSLLWTKTKTLGEEIDSWTNINQASTFNLDGDKGAISAVRNYNDNLITFQDNGIARILYNERVQVNASDGVPIELSNSGKVSGKQYLSDTIGCSNKRTIQITPNGVYFMDSNSKDICILNNGIQSVSKTKGFNNYLYNKDFSKYKTFYDEKLKDVYFTDDITSLDYSEQLGEFEGFYSYGGTDYMFNYLDSFVAIKDNKIWKQFAGDYNYFFGDNANNCKPFSLTLISNQGLNDKTFTGIEFEADTWDSNKNLLNETFDHLDIWNEYQMGTEKLNKININNHYHFSNLKEKFRIWRAQLPREVKLGNLLELPYINKNISYDNYHIVEKTVNIDKTFDVHRSMNRIRNPWAYIKLIKSSTDNHKTTLHNIKIDYFE